MPWDDNELGGSVRFPAISVAKDIIRLRWLMFAQAGYFGGWTLYMKEGKGHHEYNWFAIERTNIASPTVLAPGKHTIRYEFIPDAAKAFPAYAVGSCAAFWFLQRVLAFGEA